MSTPYRCHTCIHWRSDDELVGRCTIPETPATVNCGETGADDGCEQWQGHEPFIVERDSDSRGWHPWVIRHSGGSLTAGSFRYRDSARAAAVAMNAVGEYHPIASAAACNVPATRAALLAARKPHEEADRARWIETSQRKKKVRP